MLKNIGMAFHNDPLGNLYRLVFKNSYPQLGDEFKFTDQDSGNESFEPYYKKNILPHVKVFELKRTEALRNYRKRCITAIPIQFIIIILTVVGIFWAIETQKGEALGDAIYMCLIFYVLSSCGVAFWTRKSVRKYRANVKAIVFPEIFKFFGKNYFYSEDKFTTLKQLPELETSGIIPSYDNSYLEDYVKGKYNDTTLELIEAKLTETRGSGKNRRTVVVFNGIFILLGMNKDFLGKTVVKKDSGKMGNWFTRKFNKPLFSEEASNLNNVKLEDPVFEKKFEVYSSDQVEARYLLTTSFMERLLELSGLFSKNGVIQCSFYKNKLLLMIPSDKNRFEVGSIYQPATFIDDINLILDEMAIIFQIIDILKLEERTGL